jgi:hypothetical protein
VWLPHSFTHSHNNNYTKLNSLIHQSFLRAKQALLLPTGGIWLCYTVLYAPCLLASPIPHEEHTMYVINTLDAWLATVNISQGTMVWSTHSHIQ